MKYKYLINFEKKYLYVQETGHQRLETLCRSANIPCDLVSKLSKDQKALYQKYDYNKVIGEITNYIKFLQGTVTPASPVKVVLGGQKFSPKTPRALKFDEPGEEEVRQNEKEWISTVDLSAIMEEAFKPIKKEKKSSSAKDEHAHKHVVEPVQGWRDLMEELRTREEGRAQEQIFTPRAKVISKEAKEKKDFRMEHELDFVAAMVYAFTLKEEEGRKYGLGRIGEELKRMYIGTHYNWGAIEDTPSALFGITDDQDEHLEKKGKDSREAYLKSKAKRMDKLSYGVSQMTVNPGYQSSYQGTATVSGAPKKSRAVDPCFVCKQVGHWASDPNCPAKNKK